MYNKFNSVATLKRPAEGYQEQKNEQPLTPKTERVNTPERQEMEIELAELRVKIESAELRLADKDRIIEDYRHRLDREGEERRRLTALLTDQRSQEDKAKDKEARTGWRARLGNWIAGNKD